MASAPRRAVMLTSDVGPFSIVPRWLLDASVSAGAVKLYAILADHADRETGEAVVTRKSLARRMGKSSPVSLDSVDRAKDELMEVGALVVVSRFDGEGQRANAYQVRMADPSRTTAAPPAAESTPSRNGAAPHNKNQDLVVRETSLRSSTATATSTATTNGFKRDQPARARGSTKLGSVDGKRVTEKEAMLAGEVLDEWNEQTGQQLTARSWLQKIVMRLREHPEMLVEDHAEAITRALAEPWWEGTATIAVVYGNDAIFERCLPQNGSGPARAAKPARRYGYGLQSEEIIEMTRGLGEPVGDGLSHLTGGSAR